MQIGDVHEVSIDRGEGLRPFRWEESLGGSRFFTGSAKVSAHDAIRALADLTRGRESLQHLSAVAAELLGVSSAHVAFLSDVQEVQGGVGLGAKSIGLLTPVSESMCSVTVETGRATAIPDARLDDRVAHMPPVAAGVVRSYLGVPLEVGGLVVGALCAFDEQPKNWADEDVDTLLRLAVPICAELELAALVLERRGERVMFELAVDAAEVGAFDWHLDSDELRWDRRLLDLFGLDSETFGGNIDAFNEAVLPDDLPHVTTALATAIETCGVYSAEYRILRPDGTVRWISARGRALAGPDGLAERVLGAALDTTAEIEAEASVRRVLEAMPTAFYHLDHDWNFSYLNARAVGLLGVAASEVIGASVWERFPATVGTEFEVHYRRAVETGRPTQFEAYYPAPLDTWYDVRAWPTPDGLSVYFDDATERRQARALSEAARERGELLAEASEALSGTLDAEAAAARLAQLVIGSAADWSIVSLIEHPAATAQLSQQPRGAWQHRGLVDVAARHRSVERREELQRYVRIRQAALTDDSLAARALREDRLIVTTDLDNVIPVILAEGEARDLLVSLDPSALAVFPLRARGRTLGLLTVARSNPRGLFGLADLDIISELAARAGLAIDNARLYAGQRDLAEQLQRSLLTTPPAPEDFEIAVRYLPAAEAARVGGDWYDTFDCRDGSTLVVIGDVVGHDAVAAATMGQLRGLVRGISLGVEGGPADVVDRLDHALQTLHMETTATMVLARFTPLSADQGGGAEVVWANAGHLPPVTAAADSQAIAHGLFEPSQVLLGLDSPPPRREYRTYLPPGTVVLFYTDGLVERRGADLDQNVADLETRLSRLVSDGLTLEATCDHLLAELASGDLEDDVALVAVRIGRTPPLTSAEGGTRPES